MRSSDSKIATAREIDQEPAKGPEARRDTWPSPPPKSPDDTDRQDTIPTPAPEPGTSDLVVIPPLDGVGVDERS